MTLRAGSLVRGRRSPQRRRTLARSLRLLLIAAKVPAKAIRARLGHSSFKITMDTYGHLYEDASDHVANAMNAAFAANVHAIRG